MAGRGDEALLHRRRSGHERSCYIGDADTAFDDRACPPSVMAGPVPRLSGL